MDSTPFETAIVDLSTAGDGVGRHPDGRVVFVAQALPGDRVRATVTHSRRGVAHARLDALLAPSAERVVPRCQIAACGGCAFKDASPALQQQQKARFVVQALRRLGGLEVDSAQVRVVTGDPWGSRHRVRLHAQHLLGGWRLGYHQRHSRTLVPLTMCPVAWPELEALCLHLARLLAPLPADAGLREVEVAYSRCDGRGAARLLSDGPLQALRQDLGWFERSGLAGVELQAADGSLRFGALQLRYDHAQANHFDLRFEPGTFTQASPQINDALVAAVTAAAAPQAGPRILELHAGIGNFTVPLARAGAQVDAVEIYRPSALLCQRNAHAPGLRVRSLAMADLQAVAKAGSYDVLLADPPRRGMLAVVRKLLTLPQLPARLLYVSCDPATLARDARLLAGAGGPYALQGVTLFDMFTQTPHVETLAVFNLKAGQASAAPA